MYIFWVETENGQVVEWRRLSRTAALAMYRATDTAIPDGVKRYGWKQA